ncbi:formyltransferase family protein [Actinoplanes sp. NBRC 103695]|uniref:formyltransferase family protein n=1 Tax=Actinoplanes sp. NBRC 103695 TaxID=3032202 RepID=UPI0025548FF9|nr:formyltransferase family protein [Actinoplanes sp. NBRC 103695]
MTTGHRRGRFPVQRDLDGDFGAADLAHLTAQARQAPAAWNPGLDAAAYDNQVWRLDRPVDDGRLLGDPRGKDLSPGEPSDTDRELLHAFEVCGLWHPPVADNLADLDASHARVWLALTNRWTTLATTSGDLRLFNTACKLFGAVRARASTSTSDGWRSLADPLADTARLISTATDDLTDRLRRTQPATTIASSPARPITAAALSSPPPIVVLAGSRSSGARQFLAGLADPSPVAAVCWYDTPQLALPDASAYADAWYPPETPAPPGSSAPPDRPGREVAQHSTRTWNEVAEVIDAYRADLVVLIGMPIVPAPVLHRARLGVINAHNGALPQYRGMDAVGWAVLNGDLIVCTAHLAAPAVDQGHILAATTVGYPPSGSLRRRVKTAQLDLLHTLTCETAATGHLRAGTPQPAGRQFYRLHPHLKRVLDTYHDHFTERT